MGEPIPKPEGAYEQVIAVQADGDELFHIARNFEGIPMRAGKHVVGWGEPWAAFIAANL